MAGEGGEGGGARRVMVATIGFTADFVLRRISDLGRNAFSRIIAVALDSGDETARQRVENTFRMLQSLLTSLGIPSDLYYLRPDKAVARGKDVIDKAARIAGDKGIVEVYLTGGPRIAVTALAVAAILYEADLGAPGRIKLVSYGEAFETKVEIDAATAVKLVLLSNDEHARRIIEELRRSGPLTPNQLQERLGMARSTLYKKLGELRRSGIVVYDEETRLYRLSPQAEQLA